MFLKLVTKFKKIFRKLFNFAFKPLDFRKITDNPTISLNYRYKPVIINASLDKGIGLSRFKLSQDTFHPFVIAVREALKNDNQKATIFNVLQSYYKRVQPNNLTEFIGLSPGTYFDDIEPWCQVHPWAAQSIDERRRDKQNGKYIKNNKWYGWNRAGPASKEMSCKETERLLSLVKSIQENGFQDCIDDEDGITRVTILWRSTDDWRWFVMHGDHRTAVAAALGINTIPIRIEKFIDLNDINLWHNVRKKVYEHEQAYKFFVGLFEKKLPECYSSWKNHCLKKGYNE